MTGNLGLILAQDVLSFYLFFALMSFAAYGLVVHEGGAQALRAGRVYIVLVVIGEVALFGAMILAVAAAGVTDFSAVRNGLAQADNHDLIILLLLVGFGVKAGVLGLHVWLPLAHPVAPTPASAVVSGAMIKAGLLGWLRLLPLGEVVGLGWGQVFMVLGMAAAIYGVGVGLTQRDPKTLLAYSSVSQMGLLTAAVGLGLAVPSAEQAIVTAIAVYAVHHGLSKGALFLGVGIVGGCSGITRRWMWLILWLPALALAGAPLTSGMIAKALLKAQTGNAPDSWAAVLTILLPLIAVLTALLMGRFLMLLVPSRQRTDVPITPGLVFPFVVLVAIPLVWVWWSDSLPTIILSVGTLFDSTWPILFAVALAIGTLWVARKRAKPRLLDATVGDADFASIRIPPGDLLLPITQGSVWVLA